MVIDISDKTLPDPEDIKNDFEDYIKNKLGSDFQVTSSINFQNMDNTASEEINPSKNSSNTKSKINFSLTPKELKENLDRFIINQHEAKKALAIAICDHYRHIQHINGLTLQQRSHYKKQNILLLGPTGVGKSYLVQKIAAMIGVPFIHADATRFSEVGYMGANVDDLVKDLVIAAENDLNAAENGIIYLDEIDKIAISPKNTGKDVNGRGVQYGLLKLMEETDVDLRANHDIASQMQAFIEMQQKGRLEKQVINTRNILFIMSGAFSGLEEIIIERTQNCKLGFKSTEDSKNNAESNVADLLSTKDLINFGLEPEFIGRLPVRVQCHNLSVDDLYQILKNSEETLVKQYQNSFFSYGIQLEFSDSALRRIAELSFAEKTGARGLMTVLEKSLRDFKYELPSTNIKYLKITAEVINNPTNALQNILANIKPIMN
ncbi:MAG: AAA family ATPase [Oligoflexales bacterium]|nr:AAA family ATPase [Oligoflexales bacterium]